MFNEYSKQCKSKYISQCETFKMCDQYILIFVKKNKYKYDVVSYFE